MCAGFAPEKAADLPGLHRVLELVLEAAGQAYADRELGSTGVAKISGRATERAFALSPVLDEGSWPVDDLPAVLTVPWICPPAADCG